MASVSASFGGTSPCDWQMIHLQKWMMMLMRVASHDSVGKQSALVSIAIVELIFISGSTKGGWEHCPGP